MKTKTIKHILVFLLFVSGFVACSLAAAQSKSNKVETFTGDTKLACEAVLCLSSNSRPSECAPSINRYFGINHKKWHDTVNARRKFLALCPNTENTPQLATLKDLHSNYAGKCTAGYLNATHTKRVTYSCNCRQETVDHGQVVTVCDTCEKQVVRDDMPGYCTSYANHGYTDFKLPVYQGKVMEGGKWQEQQ